MKTQAKKGQMDRYLALVRRFPLRPIRSEAELDEAIAVLDGLLDRLDRRPWNRDEKDYVDVLGDLIGRFESVHMPIEPLPDAAMLSFLIETKGVTQVQVAKDCRIAESTISEVLAGVRKLNRGHIAKLCGYFHVEPGVFLGD